MLNEWAIRCNLRTVGDMSLALGMSERNVMNIMDGKKMKPSIVRLLGYIEWDLRGILNRNLCPVLAPDEVPYPPRIPNHPFWAWMGRCGFSDMHTVSKALLLSVDRCYDLSGSTGDNIPRHISRLMGYIEGDLTGDINRDLAPGIPITMPLF